MLTLHSRCKEAEGDGNNYGSLHILCVGTFLVIKIAVYLK